MRILTLVDLSKATNAELQIAAHRVCIDHYSSKMEKIVNAEVLTEPERVMLEHAVRDQHYRKIVINLEARINSRNVEVDDLNCCLAL